MGDGSRAEKAALRGFRGALRRRLISARMALAPGVRECLSRSIEIHLVRLLDRLAPGVVGFCWPVRGEFDARPALNRTGLRAALPVVIEEDAPLVFREWETDTQLAVDRYGIPFPAQGDELTPHVILLPTVGFDEAGFRLGYGGGYFDRTLASLTPRPTAVGVGFELGRVATIRPQPFDARLDYVVTEAGAFRVAATALQRLTEE